MPAENSRAGQRFRVGIDMHVIHGIFQGSRTHCLELFSRVVACTPECSFVLFTSDPQQLLSFSENFALPNVEISLMPDKAPPVRLLWQLPNLVRQKKLSLLHTQYIVPPFTSCSTAVTVHDILFESHPQYFEKSLVIRSRVLVPLSVRRSAAVFSVSEFSRGQISQRYSVPNEKVTVIPNGVDRGRFFPDTRGSQELSSLGLAGREFYLTVGRLEPRKNHATLLRAWALLNTPRPRLVIVGQRHFRYNDVFDLIKALRLEQDVLVLEQVTDSQIPAIYRMARGFVYCSWAEGFGMPLLEAMASGIPVISSSNTGLAEVCADAALTVDPNRPESIRDAVLALESQPALRSQLIDRGERRAREYTWEKSAEKVRSAYLQHFRIQPEKKATEQDLSPRF